MLFFIDFKKYICYTIVSHTHTKTFTHKEKKMKSFFKYSIAVSIICFSFTIQTTENTVVEKSEFSDYKYEDIGCDIEAPQGCMK